jgi:RNA polymerase sigma-B factor
MVVEQQSRRGPFKEEAYVPFATTHDHIDVAAEDANDLITAFATAEPDDPARPRLRERAIEAWLPMARRLASRYRGRGETYGDLSQVAVEGLIKAVDRYETGHGVEFPAFAIPTITGEIKRHFRDRTWFIRVPRRLQEVWQRISAANDELTHRLGHTPTVGDIAAHLSISEEEVLEGLEGARAYTATSLSTPIGGGTESTLGDLIGADDHDLERAELHLALGPAFAVLDEREKALLSFRFYGNMSQTEIAERIGISQMHVSRLLTKALGKLRKELFDDAPAPAPRARRRRPATTAG